jgi:hypothetical protein
MKANGLPRRFAPRNDDGGAWSRFLFRHDEGGDASCFLSRHDEGWDASRFLLRHDGTPARARNNETNAYRNAANRQPFVIASAARQSTRRFRREHAISILSHREGTNLLFF